MIDAPVGGRQNIGQKENLFVLQLRVLGNDKRNEISVRHPHQFGLSARVTAIRIRITEITARIPGIVGIVALAFHLVLAVKALPAGYVKRNDDPVPFFDARHFRSHFFHDAHRFMADHVVVMHAGNQSMIDMEV